MDWTLIQTPGFKTLWRAEKLPDEDLQALESAIMRNPLGAAVMKGTGGLRKLRVAPQSRGKGKSGSMRVGYVQFPDQRVILLVTLFLKNAEENLSQAMRNEIKAFVDRYAKSLSKGEQP